MTTEKLSEAGVTDEQVAAFKRVWTHGMISIEDVSYDEVVRAALEAARLSQPQDEGSGVRVKALRWEAQNVDKTLWIGVAPQSGEFRVKFNGVKWEAIRGILLIGEFGTAGEAKAAAQEHYSKAILSAIEPLHTNEPAPFQPDLALIEATARKINPGRSEDHIKSVALDALSIIRALAPSTRSKHQNRERPTGTPICGGTLVWLTSPIKLFASAPECSYAIDRYRCDIEASHRAMISAAQSSPDDGWIEWHDRKYAPNVPPATYIDVKYRDGRTYPRQPASNHPWHLGHIIAYRLSAAQSNPKGGRGE